MGGHVALVEGSQEVKAGSTPNGPAYILFGEAVTFAWKCYGMRHSVLLVRGLGACLQCTDPPQPLSPSATQGVLLTRSWWTKRPFFFRVEIPCARAADEFYAKEKARIKKEIKLQADAAALAAAAKA